MDYKFWDGTYKEHQIRLIDTENECASVFSISAYSYGVKIEETCDNYYRSELSYEQAIAALEEAITFLKTKKPA